MATDVVIPESRHTGGGWATNAIPRENPNSNGPASPSAGPRGVKNPVAADGDEHGTPPPYTPNVLWEMMLAIVGPLLGPTVS